MHFSAQRSPTVVAEGDGSCEVNDAGVVKILEKISPRYNDPTEYLFQQESQGNFQKKKKTRRRPGLNKNRSGKSNSQRGSTSIQVFKQFLSHREDGTVDASGVFSHECFLLWASTRSSKPKAPEESFRRALTAHIRGTDSRKPFSRAEEESILVLLRNKVAFRETFYPHSKKIGNNGFRGMGYHEKLRSEGKCNDNDNEKITSEKISTRIINQKQKEHTQETQAEQQPVLYLPVDEKFNAEFESMIYCHLPESDSTVKPALKADLSPNVNVNIHENGLLTTGNCMVYDDESERLRIFEDEMLGMLATVDTEKPSAEIDLTEIHPDVIDDSEYPSAETVVFENYEASAYNTEHFEQPSLPIKPRVSQNGSLQESKKKRKRTGSAKIFQSLQHLLSTQTYESQLLREKIIPYFDQFSEKQLRDIFQSFENLNIKFFGPEMVNSMVMVCKLDDFRLSREFTLPAKANWDPRYEIGVVLHDTKNMRIVDTDASLRRIMGGDIRVAGSGRLNLQVNKHVAACITNFVYPKIFACKKGDGFWIRQQLYRLDGYPQTLLCYMECLGNGVWKISNQAMPDVEPYFDDYAITGTP